VRLRLPRKRKKSRRTGKLAPVLVSGTTGAAVAAASGAPASLIGAAGLANAAGALLEAFRAAIGDRRERRFRKLIDELGNAHSGEDVDRVLATIRERLADDHDLQEVILESLRALEEVIDDAVIPPLARLIADYETKKPDSFLRGMRRLLSDLSSEEYADLQQLLRMVMGVRSRVGEEETTLYYGPDHEKPELGSILKCTYLLPPEEQKLRSLMRDWIPLGDVPHAFRLLHLLRVNGLATEGQGGMLAGAASGPGIAEVEFATVSRMAALILPVVHR